MTWSLANSRNGGETAKLLACRTVGWGEELSRADKVEPQNNSTIVPIASDQEAQWTRVLMAIASFLVLGLLHASEWTAQGGVVG